ncbi:autorepressor SdpR family transcription factor [Fulvivirga sediminis]|uniref:Winged helix-turn-helix transcriptional regulator n=1 Tax=Fulvivirga sediminis TaxID=2803949 RepID=A0A937F6B7_9BACT|nr:autorepressor SdpR family transcription factor [Fulvivirga sediminis]MBL3655807.1 winged helix-turn-helix transcriptional regulator [Fulvivirga sediminis]
MNKAFKALNDHTRREILELLKQKDMSAGEIADHFNMGKPSISHHLDLLKQAELVNSEKQGQFVIYSLSTTVIDDLLAWMINLKTKKP